MQRDDVTSYSTIQREQLVKLGAYLKEAREAQSKSVEDISLQTYIRPQLISYIESGNTADLPQPIFVQGFIRRYAEALGLDGLQLAKQFPVHSIPDVPRPPAQSVVEARPLTPAARYVSAAPERAAPLMPAVASAADRVGTIPIKSTPRALPDAADPSDLKGPQADSPLNRSPITPINTDSLQPPADLPAAVEVETPFVDLAVTSSAAPTEPEIAVQAEVETAIEPPVIEPPADSEPALETPATVSAAVETATAAPEDTLTPDSSLAPVSEPTQSTWVDYSSPSTDSFRDDFRPRFQVMPYVLAGVVVAAIIGAIALISNLSGRNAPQTAQTPPQTTESAEPPVAAAPPPEPAAAPASQAPVYVSVELSDASWMKVVVDGQVAFEGTMTAGTKELWEGQNSINITVGNAGAVKLSHNGAPSEPVGAPGNVEQLAFTAEPSTPQ
jgi:cytoskeletal protein RodZ